MGKSSTTLIMGIIAVVAVGVAMYFYPKSLETEVDAQVNQNLFESYKTADVRSIEITRLGESDRIEQIKLRRKGDSWILPQYEDFTATGIARISEVAKSMLDRKILAITGDQEQSHFEFGLVDPAEATGLPNRASLGMKVELRDRNRGDIASLIIGKPVSETGGDGKYFVRLPGQPTVYEMQIPKVIFSTRFEDWVDSNLMNLPNQRNSPIRVTGIGIDSYRIDAKEIASADKQPDWQVKFQFSPNGSKGNLLRWVDGKFEKEDISQLSQRQVSDLLTALSQIRVLGARSKPKSIVKLFRKSAEISDAAALKGLAPFGFRGRSDDEGFKIESANGELAIVTSDGMKMRLLVGSLADQTDSRSLDLNYHVLVLAEMVESVFEEPEKPVDVAEDSEENKAWLRKMAEIKTKKEALVLRIDSLNRSYSKWIHIVPESVINRLFPEPAEAKQEEATPEAASEATPAAP